MLALRTSVRPPFQTVALVRPPGLNQQRSLDHLGTPLHEVTFCVVDVETTGEPVTVGALTEISGQAARRRLPGDPRHAGESAALHPPAITVLTGITDSMVLPAPMPEDVLPTFLDFLGDAVIVGHNVRYDLSFLRAALEVSGLPPLSSRWVDTCALARRLVADEVPNCKLSTLASRMRLPHQPCHRALDGALATGDLLHLLLERAARLGVTGLDDLLGLPTIASHPQVGKLRLTKSLPGCRACTCSETARADRSTSARPATSARCGPTSPAIGDGRWASCCARPCASTIRCAPRRWRPMCWRSGSSTTSLPGSTARAPDGGSTCT